MARAGTTTNFWWGDKIGPDHANSLLHINNAKRSKKSIFDDRIRRGVSGFDLFKDLPSDATPVGTFKPNAFGLFDTAGNVWEWVEDCWNDSYAGAPADGRAWTSGDCEKRVRRGGDFTFPKLLRSASRNYGYVSGFGRDDALGFRVARTLD